MTPTIRTGRLCAFSLLAMLAPLALGAQTKPSSSSSQHRTTSQRRNAANVAAKQQPQSPDTGAIELQAAINAEKAAVASGSPQASAEAARRVVAAALPRVAELRYVLGSFSQAVELYRRALVLQDKPETRGALAAAALPAGQPDEVINQTAKLLESAPDNSVSWYLNGKGWMAKHDYNAAIASLTKSFSLKKDVTTQYNIGLAYLHLKEKEKAEEVFRQILQQEGNRPIWHVVFGGAYREAAYFQDAMREFRQALAMDPNIHRGHVYLALTMLESNEWAPTEESQRELREAARLEPRDFYANLYLGLGESQLDKRAESNKHLKLAAEVNPNLAEIWLYLGLNAFRDDNYAEAKPYLLKAVELTGDNEAQGEYEIRRGYIALGRIAFQAGNAEEAKKYTDKVRELNARHMTQQARGIAKMGEGMGGLPAVVPHVTLPDDNPVEQQVAVDPAAPLQWNKLDQKSFGPKQQEEIKRAEQSLRGILSNAYNDWGTAEARQQLYPIALEHFKEAEQWDRTTPGVMRNVGLAALKLGSTNEAMRGFRGAVEVDPTDISSRGRLAMLLFAQNEYKDAAVQFAALGDAAFEQPATAYAFAYSLARNNDQKGALEVLNRLSAMQMPAELLLSVGDLYSVFQDYEHAIPCYRRALQLEPSIPKAHYKLGAALIRLSRPAEAIPELEAELKATPEDTDVRFNLAYALLSTSQRDKAIELLRSITKDHPEHSQSQYELGKALLEEGKLEDAIPHLEAAAKLDPNTDYVHYQLQSAYRRAGRKEDADREAQIYKEIKNRKREQATIPMPERKQ